MRWALLLHRAIQPAVCRTARLSSSCVLCLCRALPECLCSESLSLAAWPRRNWGCGVFGGHVPLKAVLQWMAASEGKVRVRYFPFNENVGPELQVLRCSGGKGGSQGEETSKGGRVRETRLGDRRELAPIGSGCRRLQASGLRLASSSGLLITALSFASRPQ